MFVPIALLVILFMYLVVKRGRVKSRRLNATERFNNRRDPDGPMFPRYPR